MKAEIYRLFSLLFESFKYLLNNIGKDVKISVYYRRDRRLFSLHNKYYVMDDFVYEKRNLLKNTDNNDRIRLYIEKIGGVFMT